MKKVCNCILFAFLLVISGANAQFLDLPNNSNLECMIGQRVGITDIRIRWNAPGVKGREGQIWGTPVAHYGFTNLGFGTAKESPWRAGSDENTTISFSTDVLVAGKRLAAGTYGFAIALYPDSCTLIFSKNAAAWGTYFYKPEDDVLRVGVRQEKNLPQSREWLAYTFSKPSDKSVEVALEWERWRIPFTVEVDVLTTVLASMRSQMSGAMGFDPPSLENAARWCLDNNVNYDEALVWISQATDPRLGGVRTFNALSTQSGILRKLGRTAEADKTMKDALDNAGIMELHGYGRQLIGQKKYKEALEIFEANHKKNGDAWPVHVGLARGYSATGDLKKALEHAKTALSQAPDEVNRKSLEAMVKTLSEGKALSQ